MAKELLYLTDFKNNSHMDISRNLYKNGYLTAILKSYYSCENVFKGYYTLWAGFAYWEQVTNWHCRTIIGIKISISHKIKCVGIKSGRISRVLAETSNILFSFVTDSFCFSGVWCIGSQSETFLNTYLSSMCYTVKWFKKQTGKRNITSKSEVHTSL